MSKQNRRDRKSHHSSSTSSKNVIATISMMGLAIGATLLVEGGPWKSRAAAAATVVGIEQILEKSGFFDQKVEEKHAKRERDETKSRRKRRDDERVNREMRGYGHEREYDENWKREERREGGGRSMRYHEEYEVEEA